MKPLRRFLLFISILILFSNCIDEPIPKPLPEVNYPYTYSPLSTSAWASRNSEFQSVNIYEGLSLNEYGFVEGEIPINENDSLTEEFVVSKLELIINTYKSYLGITSNINIKNDIKTNYPLITGGGSISLKTYFEVIEEFKNEGFGTEMKNEYAIQRYFITQNKINDKNISGPTINFIFNDTDKKIEISGNWLPEVYIPKNEIYSRDEAISKIYIFILKETGNNLWESKNTFATYKIFIFLKKENKITVHECWKSKVTIMDEEDYDGYYYYIFIDTQSGEIIQNYKRSMYYY